MITIEQVILFVDTLLQKYKNEMDSQVYLQYVSKLKKIKDKNADDKLYLSVIGEFSTGKSTFINALLRDSLLDAQVLQGTTTINSVIQYGKELNMVIQSSDSVETKNLKISGYSESKIRECIKNIQSGNDVQSVKKVVISHPSEFLNQGIVIIDTPGTNTPDLWHEQVTRNAIHELSDTSIILTSASQPVPDSLVEFVQNNLKAVLERCIFIVTKIDTIRQRERDEQLEYIKYTIQQKLGIKEPVVLPYSSLLVLEEKTNAEQTYSKNDRDNILEMSAQTEKQIFEYIQANKQSILREKLSKLLVELLNELEVDLDKKIQAYQQRNNILKANTKRDLETFYNEVCSPFFEKHIEENKGFIGWYYQDLSKALENDIEMMHSALSECNNENALKNFPNYVNEAITFRKNDAIKCLKNNFAALTEKTNDFVKEFADMLNKEYSGLNALLSFDKEHHESGEKIEFNNLPNIEITIPTMESGIEIGGAIAGATIGAIFGGGLGAFVGGWLGRKIGSLFGPDINSIKSQVWSEMQPKVSEQYEKLRELAVKSLIDCLNRLDEQAGNRMDSLVTEYNDKIEYLLEQDKIEKENLERSKLSVGTDKEKIVEYRKFLANK